MPVMTTLYVPVDAVSDAESVNVVLHVAVQVAEEKEAVTPAGNEEGAKDTAAGLPVSSVAVTVSAVDWPSTTDRPGDARESEKLVALEFAEVVNVESVETPTEPLAAESARK